MLFQRPVELDFKKQLLEYQQHYLKFKFIDTGTQCRSNRSQFYSDQVNTLGVFIKSFAQLR